MPQPPTGEPADCPVRPNLPSSSADPGLKEGSLQDHPYLVPWGSQQDEAVFPLEDSTKVLALLIAAQFHCLYTFLLILGEEREEETKEVGR